jgi:hypothetical protein
MQFNIVVPDTRFSVPIESKVREPSIELNLQPEKRRRTSCEIQQSVFNFSTKAESDVAKTMLKSFGTSTSVMKIKGGERSSTVSIISSKRGANTLSSYHGRNVGVEVEPAVDIGRSNTSRKSTDLIGKRS